MKVPTISCDAAHELMSPFIDSMVAADEAEDLRTHVEECAACRRQLQSFVSLRTLMAGSEPVGVPEDLHLETRVRLSHERSRNSRERWQTRVENVLRPFAVPATAGVVVTVLCFGILLGSLTPSRQAKTESLRDVATVGVYQQVQATDSVLRRLGAIQTADLDQALSIQGEVNNDGRIDSVMVLAGNRSPSVDQWLQELVLLSKFKPATLWGLPVRSRVILSFVTVRG
jgi:hypothetical protein